MRFDPVDAIKRVKEIKRYEHPQLGTIEYVLPTVAEQMEFSKLENDEEGMKNLLFVMLSPPNPELRLDDLMSMDGKTFKALGDFVLDVLDFRDGTESASI